MRATNYLIGVLLASGISLLTPAITNAAPLSEIMSRRVGFNGMGFASIIIAVIDFLKADNAYDPNVPDKCVIRMYTTAGGDCQTYINCDQDDTGGIDLSDQWQVCYKGGRQFFNDPHIGDFSITFSKAGGVDGDTTDGLHTPILQLAAVNNWDPLDVDATAQRAKDHDTGNLCAPDNTNSVQQLGWKCGVPTLGKSGFGLDSNTAVQTSGFAPGWCTMHVVQYQRNENGIGADYAFDVLIYDANKTPVGQVSKAGIDGATKVLDVNSNLPYVLIITADGGDNDPVKFAYAGQSWDSNDRTVHQSNMGTGPADGYQDGSRQGDMGFTC